MKDLIIPIKKTDSIDISEITDDFSGIIIVYKDTSPIGYIQYVSGDWNYYDSIDGECPISTEKTLYELITTLNKIYNATFKVIEFI